MTMTEDVNFQLPISNSQLPKRMARSIGVKIAAIYPIAPAFTQASSGDSLWELEIGSWELTRVHL